MSLIISSSGRYVPQTVNVIVLSASNGGTKQLTVGTTPVQASTEPMQIKAVTIEADDDNTGSIYIGFSSNVSTTTGFRLAAGKGIDILIDDLSKIWLVADTTDQKAHLIYVW